jgi:hypothetical protein
VAAPMNTKEGLKRNAFLGCDGRSGSGRYRSTSDTPTWSLRRALRALSLTDRVLGGMLGGVLTGDEKIGVERAGH